MKESTTNKSGDDQDDDTLLRYSGVFDVKEPTIVSIKGDKGLVMTSPSSHHVPPIFNPISHCFYF